VGEHELPRADARRKVAGLFASGMLRLAGLGELVVKEGALVGEEIAGLGERGNRL
jgi:hypothetical protein